MRTELSQAAVKVPWVGPRVAVRLHRAGLGVSAITWDALAGKVEREQPDAVSVDVFDTCVVRDLLGDSPIELAISRQSTVDPVDGEELAYRAEPAARLEALLCRPVPEVAAALARIRAAGVQIVFLSDTDRSSELLRDILERNGIHVSGDRLIASCEAGATKSDGDLFTKIWPDQLAVGRRVWHVGNNLWSDVTMAEQAGLRAFAIVDAEPTRYEAAMAVRSETAGPAIASAARNARLEIAARPGIDATSADAQLEVLGAEVAGQAFGAFVLWLAEQARSEGLVHLSFLSRDGQLPLEIARAMPRDHWDGIQLSYLHCSRWSWLLAGASSIGLSEWLKAGTRDSTSFIHVDRYQVPLASLLSRIGLEPADLGGHPELAALDPSEPLSDTMVDQWEALVADPAIGELILTRSELRRSLITDYLRQLGLPAGPVGLVDVGWRGRLAWVVSALVREVTGHEPVHFHFGGDKVLPDADAVVDIRRFAFDGRTRPFPITNPVSCVEALTATGSPRLLGYQRTADGSVLPMHEPKPTPSHHRDRRHLWAGALRTGAHLPSRALLDQLGTSAESLGPEANRVLSLWWTTPVRAEVEAMRGLVLEADGDGHAIAPIVTPYSAKELSWVDRRPRQWQQGSAVVSPRPFGPALNRYRSLRARLARRRPGAGAMLTWSRAILSSTGLFRP
jgi:FMN phosphatase YigB (HAD superfamily)